MTPERCCRPHPLSGRFRRPLPFPDSSRLVAIWKTDPARYQRRLLSYEQFTAIRTRCSAFDEVGTDGYGTSLQIPGIDVRLTAHEASASLMRALRAPVVLGPGFAYPYPNPWAEDAWIPLNPARDDSARNPADSFLRVVGRLRPGAGAETAQAQLDLVASQLAQSWPEYKGQAFRVRRLNDGIAGSLRTPLLVFLGGAGLLLLRAENV